MKVTVGEIIAVVLIVAALSLGFLGATPTTSSHSLSPISTNAVSKYLGGSWSINYVYIGSGYYAKIQTLQQFKNSEVLYENLTDSLGDELIILYVYPYHGQTTTYHSGFTTLISMNSGNAYIMVSYIGNSTIVSESQLQALANYIIDTE